MNEFDQAARFTAKLDPPGLFSWLVPDLDPAFTFGGWLDTRTVPFPGEKDRTCDTVAEFRADTDPLLRLALVLEFQAWRDPDMLERLLEYPARLRRELRYGPRRRHKYVVVAALVNLTGPPQTDALEMVLPGDADYGLRFKGVVRTLRDMDASAMLSAVQAGNLSRCLLPWVPLLRGGAEPSIMEEWKRAARGESNERLRSQYAGLALVFADLAKRKLEWQQLLKGWTMRRSEVVEEWREEARIETRRETLLQALRVRFATPVPRAIRATIEKTEDKERLSQWFEAALTAPSLKAFREAAQL